MRRVVLLVAVLAIALPTAAHAVWGGQEDLAHPGVGAMYFDFMGNGVAVPDGLVCSGSYAGRSKSGANDVFLTAGHCMPPPELGIPASALLVSFDPDGRNGVSSPIKVDAYYQMPGFGQNLGRPPRPRSAAAACRDRCPPARRRCSCRRAGYLDQLKAAGTLKFRIADIVGYGVTPIWEPAGPTQFAFDGVRRSGTSTIIGLDKPTCTSRRTATATARAPASASATPARRSSTGARCSSSR